MTEQPTDLDQLAGLLGETNVLLRDLVSTTTSATELVEAERREREAEAAAIRKVGTRAILAVLALLLAVVLVGGRIIFGQIEAARIPCAARVQSRADTRSMGVALVDGLAAHSQRATPAQRKAIHDLSVKITRDKLPPPDC